MRLIDTHCHWQSPHFPDDIAPFMERARLAAVTDYICCGTQESDWDAVLAIAARYACVHPALGIHPWYLKNRSAHWFETWCSHLDSDINIVGEIGLDWAIECDRDEQDEVFVRQWREAVRRHLPVSLHCRKAFDHLMHLVRIHGTPRGGFVIHSYSGSPEMIPILTEMGAYFSFSGTATYSRNTRAQRNILAVPLARLLIETDAPDLSPAVDGVIPEGPNLPERLPLILKRVAQLREVDEDELSLQLFSNATRVFSL